MTTTATAPPRASISRLVVAVTGPVGSGVSTVSHVLAQLGFHRISLSAAIKQEYRKREKIEGMLPFDHKTQPDWRADLQDIGDEKRKDKPDYWVDAALAGAPTDRDLVVDNIRNVAEISALRERYASCFVIAVVATPQVRWARLTANYDGDFKAFERDDRRDADEDLPHGQQVEKCVGEADYVIWNEQDFKPSAIRDTKLRERIEPDIRLMRGQSNVRYPTPAETYIASAYAASHSSRCLKRFVGALIVSEDGLPLSVGFNENPVGMQPCETHFGYCFKDANMHARLEEMRDTHCPQCGEVTVAPKAPWRCAKCKCDLKLKFFPSRNMELCTAIHAEERAIRSLHGREAAGATMYVTTFPCLQCSRYIIDVGIMKVVYVEAYPVKEAAELLKLNGVTIEPFEGFKARAFNRLFKQRS